MLASTRRTAAMSLAGGSRFPNRTSLSAIARRIVAATCSRSGTERDGSTSAWRWCYSHWHHSAAQLLGDPVLLQQPRLAVPAQSEDLSRAARSLAEYEADPAFFMNAGSDSC
jgi:hypothetical protein